MPRSFEPRGAAVFTGVYCLGWSNPRPCARVQTNDPTHSSLDDRWCRGIRAILGYSSSVIIHSFFNHECGIFEQVGNIGDSSDLHPKWNISTHVIALSIRLLEAATTYTWSR